MQHKYRFPAIASVAFPIGFYFKHGGRTFEFEVADGLLKSLNVTVPGSSLEHAPSVVLTPDDQKSQATIRADAGPGFEMLQNEVRAIEGGLCMWGVESINVDEPEIQFIADNPVEAAAIDIESFSISKGERDPTTFDAAEPALYIRTVMISKALEEIEMALNFYRRGRADCRKGKYIEGIYNLYFVLEHLFANGKYGESGVLKEFEKSPELQRAIDRIRNNIPAQISGNPRLSSYFESVVTRRSNLEVMKWAYKVRGFLFHQSSKRSTTWHPSRQGDHWQEGVLFLALCTEVVLNRINSLLFDETIMDAFMKLEVLASDGGLITWREDSQ
ncbi:MAG: hypothetical protein ACKVQW_07935 [Pyrinomonadaceae bacterium]